MNDRGLTLIEALVASTILALILALSGTMFSTGARVFSRETVAIELLSDMAGAKNVILDDLSIAGYQPDAAGLAAFANLPGADNEFDAIEFVGDIDSDGVSERVCYSVTGGVLQRSVEQNAADACGTNGVMENLASNIQTFAVSFWDDADPRVQLTGNEVLAGDAVTARVTLLLGQTVRSGDVTRTITGEVALRNS